MKLKPSTRSGARAGNEPARAGVRPSPGAATSASSRALELPSVPRRPEPAAPGDANTCAHRASTGRAVLPLLLGRRGLGRGGSSPMSVLRFVGVCRQVAARDDVAGWVRKTASSPWPSPPEEERETAPRSASTDPCLRSSEAAAIHTPLASDGRAVLPLLLGRRGLGRGGPSPMSGLRFVGICRQVAARGDVAGWVRKTASSPRPSPPEEERETTPRSASTKRCVTSREDGRNPAAWPRYALCLIVGLLSVFSRRNALPRRLRALGSASVY